MQKSQRRSDRSLVAVDSLVSAGLRLFAERGIKAVTIRDISVAAGHTNNAAVNYYFGSKDRLVREIFLRNSIETNLRREQLLEGNRAPDAAQIARALVLPFCEQAGSGNPYPEFLRQLIFEYEAGSFVPWIDRTSRHYWTIFIQGLLRHGLSHSSDEAHLKLSLAVNVALSCLSRRQLSLMPSDARTLSLLPPAMTAAAAVRSAQLILELPVPPE